MYKLDIAFKNSNSNIYIKQGIASSDKFILKNLKTYSNIFIISQQSVLDIISCSFVYKYPTIIIKEKEACKSLDTVEDAISQLIELGCDRNSLLIGIGGGTVTDLTGFIASIFMRGIDHVFIPTTLMAMVDASIGGKTAVNSSYARNAIGTFKQPKAIYIDAIFLKTLSKNNIIHGFAEIIKYGLIIDKNLYKFISLNFKDLIYLKNLDQIESIIYKCCKHKITFVEKDEFDKGSRMMLNFGHTIGHAIESLLNYDKISHGEAVYYGMIAATFISKKNGLISKEKFDEIYNFLNTIIKFPIDNIDSKKLYDYIQYDKKKINNHHHFIVLHDIGTAGIIRNISSKNIKDAINFILKHEYTSN
tara:strand:- start:578 stop:1660 length:1083 start_codon:yes stop_codon:yes gene_type:complete